MLSLQLLPDLRREPLSGLLLLKNALCILSQGRLVALKMAVPDLLADVADLVHWEVPYSGALVSRRQIVLT